MPDDGAESTAARRLSERQFLEAVDQNLEVHKLAEKLREQRERNQWGRLIEESWLRRRSS